MQTSKSEDSCLRRESDVSEFSASMPDVDDQDSEIMPDADDQDSKIKYRVRQQSDPRCTPISHTKPPPYSEGRIFNVTEMVGTHHVHRNPADVPDILYGSQNAVIKQLNEELDQCQKQSDINFTKAQTTEDELKNEQAKFSALLKEFNKAKVHSRSHMIHHVSDSELSEKVQQLRYNISSFTIQCFEDDPPVVEVLNVLSLMKHFQPKTKDLLSSLKHLGLNSDAFSNLMRSHSSRRISVVQALIWATLCETLFGKFAWTSDKTSSAITHTEEYLHPEKNLAFKEDRLEALRRWHTWRATTSIALLEALAAEAEAGQDRQNDFCDKTIKYLERILKPFAGSENNNFATELREIVQEAIEMDKVMNKQVPALTWIYRLDQLPDEYSMDQMEFNSEDRSEMIYKDDWLIVNPGLKKTGKSTGQDFDQVTFLLKTTLVDKSSAIANGLKKRKATT